MAEDEAEEGVEVVAGEEVAPEDSPWFFFLIIIFFTIIVHLTLGLSCEHWQIT